MIGRQEKENGGERDHRATVSTRFNLSIQVTVIFGNFSVL